MTDEQTTGWTGGQSAFGDFAPGMVDIAATLGLEAASGRNAHLYLCPIV